MCALRSRVLALLRSTIFHMRDAELITVGNYTFLPEAEIAQGILDEAGIESVLLDDNAGRMLSWIAVGGFRLQVNKGDADAAITLLSAPQPTPAEDPVQPHCPNCDSSDILSQETTRPAAYIGASLLTPVDVRETSWKCNSCGHCWDNQGR